MPATAYTGPTDPYGSATSTFPGPYVRTARILAVDTVQVGPADGPRRSATRLTLANNSQRGPHVVEATVDSPAHTWVADGAAQRQDSGARDVVAALTAAGIPARFGRSRLGVPVAAVRIATRTGTRMLRIAAPESLTWQLEGASGGRWPGTRPSDAPEYVSRWLRVAKAIPVG
ncbi:hypothetical protein ACFWXO_31010 [Kitasatospora sp. NPDC059088]|uniref:hypothetical protein n=1 Tax=Kitasatospora sp. NPDC059088 TaxID=3346722 RepID=UPI003674E830